MFKPPLQPTDAAAALVPIIFLSLIAASASGLWWQIDDTQILKHALEYRPWDYFAVPSAWRQFSSAHLTPWVLLSFDLDLWLFGLDAPPFYLHQWVAIALAALASYALLRLWVAPWPSALGIGIFLLGAPMMVVAHQLMTRHYVEGLLMGALALFCYVAALRGGGWRWALLGSLCYLLAGSAKEIFPPLVGVLPFLPEGRLRKRLLYALPFLGAGVLYGAWRYYMLGQAVGGYEGGIPDWLPSLGTRLTNIGQILLGDNLLGQAAGLALLVALVWILVKAPRRAPLILAIGGAVLLPLIFVGPNPDPRHLLGLWWALCLGMTSGLAVTAKTQRRGSWIAFALMALPIATTLTTGLRAGRDAERLAHIYATYGRFWLGAGADTLIFVQPPLADMGHYFRGLSALKEHLTGPSVSPVRVVDEIDLVDADLDRQRVWTFDEECACMRDMTPEIPRLMATWAARRQERPLRVEICFGDGMARWRFGPYAEGTYYLIDARDVGRIRLPLSGTIRTSPRSLSFYIRHDAPDGWFTYSPRLHLNLSGEECLTWSRE